MTRHARAGLALLAAAALAAAGCGVFARTPSQDQQQRKLRDLKQAALIIEQAGLVAEQAQLSEIEVFEWGQAREAECLAQPDADPLACAAKLFIRPGVHALIKTSFGRVADSVLEALDAMKDLTRPDAARREALERALDGIDTLMDQDILGIEDEQTRGYIRAAIGAARVVLLTVLPLIGGAA